MKWVSRRLFPEGFQVADRETCEHESFVSSVVVNRIADEASGKVLRMHCEISIRCVLCSAPIRFRGLGYGLDGGKATISADGTELRAPGDVAA
jgi:hypothetical protein